MLHFKLSHCNDRVGVGSRDEREAGSISQPVEIMNQLASFFMDIYKEMSIEKKVKRNSLSSFSLKLVLELCVVG